MLFAASIAGERNASAREITQEQRTEARALVAEASAAFEAGNFQRALTLFDRAAAIVEAPTIALMQARTLVELGRLGAAAERYLAAQRTDPAVADNAAFRSAAAEAKSELEALRPSIPTLRIKLVGAQSEDAVVAIDGRTLAPEAVATEQLLDAGPHNIEVKTAAGTTAGRAITLVPGAREEVVFSLEPVVHVPNASYRRTPEPAPVRDDATPKPRTAAWITLGTGVAFTGAATVLGVLALGHKSDLDAACNPGCPEEYRDDLDTYRLERTLSYVGFAIGAVGVGSGIYLLLRSEPGSTSAALALSPSGVSLSGRFQ
ncbi:MAG TPA: hypothetical protein VGK73_40825 [Polyangiaceae bacterium]